MRRILPALTAMILSLLAPCACNHSVDSMVDDYNGGFTMGYTTVDTEGGEDEEVLQPGEQGFDQSKMLRDEYFLGYDATLNLFAPVTSERFEWFISDPEDEYETRIQFCPCNFPYDSEYTVTEVTTQTFSLYAEDSQLENGTTYKLTLNVWKGGKRYTDYCSLVVYQHYEWNQ